MPSVWVALVTQQLKSSVLMPISINLGQLSRNIMQDIHKEFQLLKSAKKEVKTDTGTDHGAIVSFDGTFIQKRSDLGLSRYKKVIAVNIRTKYCPKCRGNGCESNCIGASGNMETVGAIEIFKNHDKEYELKVIHYLEDEDSKHSSKRANQK